MAATIVTLLGQAVSEFPALTDADAAALAAYLKSLPAVRHQAPPPTGADGKPPAPYLGVMMPQ